MKRVVEMPLEAGGVISIELADASPGHATRGGGESVLDRSAKSFEAAVALVRPVALAVVRQFTDLVDGTSSVRITFGLKFTAEAGAIIASAGSEANFEIEIKWGRESA